MKRKLMACLVAIAFLGAAGPALAEKIQIRLGHVAPPVVAQHKGAEVFKKYVESKSNGAIEVSVYPAGQLGGERAMVESIQIGTLEMGIITTAVLTNFVPETAVFNLPFFYPNKASIHKVFESEVGEQIEEAFAKKGFKLLTFQYNGYRNFGTTKKPVKTPEDLADLKIRSIESPLFIDAYKALGNKPIPLPFPEVANSLQQGVVDGLDLHLEGLWGAKMPVKYVSLARWILSGIIVFMNKPVFDRLSPELQTIVMEGAFEGKLAHLGAVTERELMAVDAMKEKGIQFNSLTPEERALFVEKIKPVHEKWRERIGADLFDKAAAIVNK